jgi:hypothetical protein
MRKRAKRRRVGMGLDFGPRRRSFKMELKITNSKLEIWGEDWKLVDGSMMAGAPVV